MLLSGTALLVSVLTRLSPNATASLVETLATLTAAATDAAAVSAALGDGGGAVRPTSASAATMMLDSLRPVGRRPQAAAHAQAERPPAAAE